MRAAAFAIAALIAACGGTDRAAEITGCASDDECALAGSSCCACPSYALGVDDPSFAACDGLSCQQQGCANNVRASCVLGTCQLACAALSCGPCATGYALDPDGCLTCDCAASNGCGSDTDCHEVRADCCGCALGGSDTAAVGSGSGSDQCPAEPQCPGTDTCDHTAQPRCVAGRCLLLSPSEQMVPAGTALCPGSDGSLGCTPEQTCTVNVVPAANAQGVGVCLPL